MSTSAQVAAYEHEARMIPGLPENIVYLPDNPAVVSGLQAKMGDGNPPYVDRTAGYIEGAPSYTVTRRIALHEFGHLWHFTHRDRQDAFWTARFGSCVTAPATWDIAYKDAHPVAGTEIWMVLPGETIAECFAVAVEGAGHERTLDYGCTIDPAAMRTFLGFTPTAEPTIEWVGPPAVGNYMAGRSGNPVALIVDHWTVGSLASALSRFQQIGQQVSAHYIVGAFGRIVQVVKDEDTAFHAGDFNVNLISIGIEHEASPTLAPTDVLYRSSALLHRYLAQKYNLDLEVGVTVKRHNNIVPTQCPGTLDLDRIVAEATGGDMDRATFNQWFAEQYLATIDPTIVAMKNTYDPIAAKFPTHKHPTPSGETDTPKVQ